MLVLCTSSQEQLEVTTSSFHALLQSNLSGVTYINLLSWPVPNVCHSYWDATEQAVAIFHFHSINIFMQPHTRKSSGLKLDECGSQILNFYSQSIHLEKSFQPITA
jgi:hypothetical protein